MKARRIDQINVAVTGLSSSDSPSPGIGVIHSLRTVSSININIIAIAYDKFSDGIHSLPLADKVILTPFPQTHPEQFLKKLKDLVSKISINCLIPCIDVEVAVISRLSADLEGLGIRVLLPREDSLKAISKEKLVGLGPFKKFNLPQSVIIHSRNDLFYHSRTMRFPLVVKGPLGEARKASSLTEAGVYFDLLAKTWGTPVILQSAIQGEEYAVACLADRRNETFGAVAMKKIIQDDTGTTWAGISVKEPELIEIVQTLLKHFKWVGPLEMEFIKEVSSGEYYLIEINNRFPAWIYLATRAGQNMPLAYLRLALGERIKPFEEYQSGLLFVRVADDLVTDLGSIAGLLNRGEWDCHEKKKKRSL